MKSKYSHVIMLLSAIAAFLPVLGVDYLLDSYVRMKERAQLQQVVDSVTERVRGTAQDAIGSLRTILATSPSLCTPTFIANVHRQMESSLYLKQVLVENADGVQYCDAFGKQVSYSPLSESLSIPGNAETMTIVKLGEMPTPVIKVTQNFGGQRKVSAFVPLIANPPDSLLRGLKPTAMVRLSLTNGTSVLSASDPAAFDNRGDTEFLSGQSIAGEIPVRAEAAVPFAMVRADYADLDASFTIVACLMSGAFLILSLQYVRRSKLPAFDLERAIEAG
ncbi:MAG: hypothetical protein EOP19_15570, partial [Hyphomicrobiales bacterium]